MTPRSPSGCRRWYARRGWPSRSPCQPVPWNDLAATAVEAVTGEQDRIFSVLDSGGGGVDTEAREDGRSDGTDLETAVK